MKNHRTCKSRNKRKPLSEEHKKKLSIAHKGKIPWNKGRKEMRLEVLQKLSDSHKGHISGMIGKHHSEESNEKNRRAHLGKKQSRQTIEKRIKTTRERYPDGVLSREARKRISETLMGHSVSPETRRKIREAAEGRKASESTRKKMSQAHKGNTRGFKKGNKPWNTGLTKETDSRVGNLGGWRNKESVEAHIEKIRIARSKQIIPVKDTVPEKIVQRILGELDISFKTHVPVDLGNRFRHQVDILLLDSPDIFEVDGCYWHQCEQCGFNSGYRGLSAAEIRRRDVLRDEALRLQGFNVHRIWGHETKNVSRLTDQLKEEIML